MLWSMLIGAEVGESSACAKPTDERWPFMPKLKPGTVIPNKEDDADINRGIFSDPDTYELGTAQMKHLRRVGRPRSPSPKVSLTVSYDADIVEAFKAGGDGWQTRMHSALRDGVKTNRATGRKKNGRTE